MYELPKWPGGVDRRELITKKSTAIVAGFVGGVLFFLLATLAVVFICALLIKGILWAP